jgi:hypothetical protein
VFSAVSEVKNKSDSQPDQESEPVGVPKFCHQEQATEQSENGNQRKPFCYTEPNNHQAGKNKQQHGKLVKDAYEQVFMVLQ